jgi:hypothetical protein
VARGRVITPELTTVYVVHWKDDGIVKAGTTILPSRVKKFTNRGAMVLSLFHDQTVSLEREIHRELARIGSPAFATWQDGIAHLGAGGTGYSECYSVPPSAMNGFLFYLRGVANGEG